DGGADKESPYEHLRAVRMQAGRKVLEQHASHEGRDREENRHDEVEAVQENELGIFREIANLGVVGREIAAAGDPADVRPKETVHVWGVGVFRLIAVLVMVAVVVGPPERTALDGGAGEDREHELAETRGAIRFVREIPMMDAGDGKH